MTDRNRSASLDRNRSALLACKRSALMRARPLGRWLPCLLLLQGCSVVGAPRSHTPAADSPSAGWTETGVASWYGEPFHGRTTASGETYDMDELTAAHQTLPFGTRVRVENLDNGRSVTLRITDRGPFVGGRILDVSRRGAQELEMIGPGTARVRITIVGDE